MLPRKRKAEEEEEEKDTYGPGFMASTTALLNNNFDQYNSDSDDSSEGEKKKIKVKHEELVLPQPVPTFNDVDCPLCKYGLFTFQTSTLETAIGNLIKRTVLNISKHQVIAEICRLLEDFRQQQLKDLQQNKLPNNTKILPSVTKDEVDNHITEHMTEITWELRGQIDDQREVIKKLKEHLMSTDPETGEEKVNHKNVQLLQVAYVNLRKTLTVDVGKAISYNEQISSIRNKPDNLL